MISRETLAFRTLLDVARQREGLDESRCRLVLEFLSTAAAIRTNLNRALATLGLGELKLGVLVVLFGLDPTPATPADLAVHTGATRSAMTDVLDGLESRAYVRRERDHTDRRLIYVHLTDLGRAAAETALVQFLRQVGHVARHVPADAGPPLLTVSAQLVQGCE